VLTRSSTPSVSPLSRPAAALPGLLLLLLISLSSSCNRFHPEHHETVYLSARQMYLHDRVAAVSNRVAQVTNGQKLDVLEHGRRFLKVRTEKNEIGWIEERACIDSKTFQAFSDIATRHQKDPVVATGVVRDDIYLHLLPGRDTERFYLLAANAKVQMLVRASVLKTGPGMAQAPRPAPPPVTTPGKPAAPPVDPKPSVKLPPPAAAVAGQPEPEPPPMEDWWLVRDAQGHAGWMLAGRLDTDVPDEIGIYAEGQRVVGVYVLNKIIDSEASTPNHEVPQYLALLSPPKSGLPFDFDQVRVFTWSVKRHRYETAFRMHPIQGYLPVKVEIQAAPGGSLPTFSFQVAGSPNVVTDPGTGVTRPAAPRTLTYQMKDTQVRRAGADMAPIPSGRSAEAKAKAAKGKSGKPVKKKRK